MPAVWKEQHLKFFYMGRTSRYSCDGLRDKVRAMLLDLGARRDIRSFAASAATSGAATARLSGIVIVFSSPALPDAAAKPLHPGDLTAVDARFETVHHHERSHFATWESGTASWSRSLRARSCRSW